MAKVTKVSIPANSVFTTEQKKQILDSCLKAIGGGFECIRGIYKEHGVAMPTINRWISEIPEYQTKIEDAKSVRAIGYALEAKKVLDDCVPFYETGACTKKDSMAVVKLAETRSNVLFRFAGALDPAMWGDMAKEVRELQKEIKKLQDVVKGSNAEMFGKISQLNK